MRKMHGQTTLKWLRVLAHFWLMQ